MLPGKPCHGVAVGRGGLAEGEAGELDEDIFHRDIAFARLVQERRLGACGWRSGKVGRIDGGAALRAELHVGLTEGADNAIFGGGAGIDRQCDARARRKVVAIAIVLPDVARPCRLSVNAAIEGGVDTQITAKLDAGIGARDIEEASAVKRADPDVFDRLGLDGKIGGPCPANGDWSRRPSREQRHQPFRARTSSL